MKEGPVEREMVEGEMVEGGGGIVGAHGLAITADAQHSPRCLAPVSALLGLLQQGIVVHKLCVAESAEQLELESQGKRRIPLHRERGVIVFAVIGRKTGACQGLGEDMVRNGASVGRGGSRVGECLRSPTSPNNATLEAPVGPPALCE